LVVMGTHCACRIQTAARGGSSSSSRLIIIIIIIIIKVKLSLCLTKHHAMEAYWGVEVYLLALNI